MEIDSIGGIKITCKNNGFCNKTDAFIDDYDLFKTLYDFLYKLTIMEKSKYKNKLKSCLLKFIIDSGLDGNDGSFINLEKIKNDN